MLLTEQQLVAGRYQLIEQIGEGGFGVVWAALDTATRDRVAVKFLKGTNDEAGRRFEVEARALERVDHPHCVRALDNGRTEAGQPFLVTEFAHGIEFGRWVASGPSVEAIVEVGRQIASALASAHREGVVHRDMKPANLLVDRDANGAPFVRVLDFGIAKIMGRVEADITKTGEVIGTAGYMSPEQLRGQKDIGPATDLYALGVLLYEMLESEHPFRGDSALAIAMAHLRALAPPLTRDVPPRLADLVALLLEKDPTRRPGSAALVERQLAALQRPSQAETEAPDQRRSRLPWALLGGTVLVVACALALALAPNDSPDAPTPPRAPRRPNSLLKKPIDTQQTNPRSSDVGADAGATADCTGLRPLAAGVQRLGMMRDGTAVRIPTDYDPTRLYPVIVAFHDGFQTPEDLLQKLDFDDVDSESEYVVVAPRGDAVTVLRSHWVRPEIMALAMDELDAVGGDVCIDSARTFALGYGDGAKAAHLMLCERPTTLGIATYAARFNLSGIPCGPPVPRPTLFIATTDDPIKPKEGGRGCIKKHYSISISDHADLLGELNGCGTGRTKHGACEIWSCDTPLEVCAVPGGHSWPKRTTHFPAGFLLNNCPDTPVEFGVTQKIWEFFDSVDQRAN